MNMMRWCICLSCIVLLSGDKAIADSFNKKTTVEVRVYDGGQPLEGADVRLGFKRRFGIEEPEIKTMQVDANGFVQISSESSGQVSVTVSKNGYYKHYESLDLSEQIQQGDISTNRTIELKRIVNPVPMYVKYVGEFIPEDEEPIGYDLEKGDWVAPYGNGVKNDILFETNFEANNESNFNVGFTITFPGEYNGVQPMYSPYSEFEGSQLKSNHLAPIDGYQSEIQCLGGRKKGAYSFKTPNNGKIAGYYFRIRTELDENGNIKSAQYGKIYGVFKYGRRFDTKTNFTFLYYYNPDKTRNVEFDPKRNLFLRNVRGRPKTCYSIGTP